MTKQTQSYFTATMVCLFFVFMHLGRIIDLGGFAVGLAFAALVFAILAFASSKKDRKAKKD